MRITLPQHVCFWASGDTLASIGHFLQKIIGISAKKTSRFTAKIDDQISRFKKMTIEHAGDFFYM